MTLPPSVRCCLFDAVGTLIYPCPSVARAYGEAGRRQGSSLSDEEIGERFRLAFRGQEAADLGQFGSATDESRERERWRVIVAEVFDDLPDTSALFTELWAHFAEPGHWCLFDDVAESWRRLAAKGVSLGIASNFDARLRNVCAGLAPLDHCDWLFVSSQVGVRKPSSAFFREVERRIGFEPHELALVGDDWESDYLAAKAAGWHAVYLARNSQPPVGARSIRSLRELCGP